MDRMLEVCFDADLSSGRFFTYGAKKNKNLPMLPTDILEEIFCYLELPDIYRCMQVCRRFNSVIFKRDKFLWKKLCPKLLPKAILEDRDLIQLFPDRLALIRAFFFSWNPEDISETMYVKPDCFTVYRRPIAQCTDAVRGKLAVSKGVHAFDFIWKSQFGTSATIGFATYVERLHCAGYDSLLGRSNHSWVWNLVEHTVSHAGSKRPFPNDNNTKNIVKTEPFIKIRMIINCDLHWASFERGDESLGIAFKNLPSVEFYPVISAVYGHSEVSMYYMGPAVLG